MWLVGGHEIGESSSFVGLRLMSGSFEGSGGGC